MDMAMDMVMAIMDTMARGPLRLNLDMVIMAMDMVLVMVMDMAMVIMDIMARDLLMLSQLLLLSLVMDMVMDMGMDILAMDMVVMDIMDIMARGLLMLSQDMDTMVMDTDMDMVMVTMDTMARGPLSQDMDIMAMDMDMMDMVMAMDMDTMVKQKAKCCYFLEFNTPEVDHNRSSQHKHTC